MEVNKGGKGVWVKGKVVRVHHHSVGLAKEIYIDCSEFGIGRAQMDLDDEPLRQSTVGGSCSGSGSTQHHRVGSNLSEVGSPSSSGSDKKHAMGMGSWG